MSAHATGTAPAGAHAAGGRLERTFARLAAQNRAALVPYLPAGYPDVALTVPLLRAMAGAGADVIELGVPFSDPMADGPVIQKAAERALAQHVGLARVFELVAEFRRHDADTPLVLMGYCNPIERLGVATFAQRAAQAGVDGVLVVDCPPEEAADYLAAFDEHRLDPIFLLAPTSTERRIGQVAALARGYVYYVSLKGITGAGHIDVDAVAARVPQLRERIGLPVGVGFGIRDAATAARIGAFADAVVIGTRVIEVIDAAGGDPPTGRADAIVTALADWIAGVRHALDAARDAAAVKDRTR